jgi:glycosyltransferase involved in cell wall biosynthesis
VGVHPRAITESRSRFKALIPMTAIPRMPLIWINVSTSAGWNRPAVGIVRVERSLAEHLRRQLGEERCKLCIWQDDQFVEWIPTSTNTPAHIAQAVDAILPPTKTFDLARPFLTRAIQRFSVADKTGNSPSKTLHVALPTSKTSALRPAPGDFIVSVGLDWDMPYSSRFHEMATKSGLRIITCCYDLIPVLFPQYCVGEVAKRFTEYFIDLSWGSEAVLCISEQTRRDYVQLCEQLGAPSRKTVVIPLGDTIPSGMTGVGEEVLSIARAPFILFVSTIERRKNHEVLYRAYHLLVRRGLSAGLPKLVFVGMPGWGVGDLLKDIELDPLTKGLIVQLNHVTDSELGHLYEHSLFCVFPSLYEGWGLPVGEALAVGKVVIASNEGSLPEVGGDLVRYVSAWDPYAWADAIQEYVANPQLVRDAERKIKSDYRPRQWSDTARRVGGLISELVADRDVGVNSEITMELLPGYDLSTLCGMHVGPSVQSTGSAGLLLFGPHRALRRNRYEAQIFGMAMGNGQAIVLLEIVSGHGQVVHAARSFEAATSAEVRNWCAVLSFELQTDVLDLEIKCTIREGVAIQFDRITICPVGKGHLVVGEMAKQDGASRSQSHMMQR